MRQLKSLTGCAEALDAENRLRLRERFANCLVANIE